MLSIIIPVYNETDTWRDLLARVEAVELPGELRREVILVDDGSTDGTREQLREFARENGDGENRDTSHFQMAKDGMRPCFRRVVFHEANRGKGAALRTGFEAAEGDFVIVQDADLEYDPNDYPALLEPMLAGEADVVYGSRFLVTRKKGYLKNYLANRFLTGLSNLTTGLRLTDMETCYKLFRRSVLGRIALEQDRFGFEPEVTAKIARLGVRIVERPIRYDPRTSEEGKKIGFKDGLQAIRCILRYGLRRRR